MGGPVLDLLEVVGGDENRRPSGALADDLHHELTGLEVEPRGHLVEDVALLGAGQDEEQRHSLFLTTGKRAHPPVQERRNAQHLPQVATRGDSDKPAELADPHEGVKGIRLKLHTSAARIHTSDASGMGDLTEDRVDERRLSCSVAAQHGHHCVVGVGDRSRKIQRQDLPVTDREITDNKHEAGPFTRMWAARLVLSLPRGAPEISRHSRCSRSRSTSTSRKKRSSRWMRSACPPQSLAARRC